MITRVKWKNHNILGNLELDFTKYGKPCNTIVIAGENGTGKTTILETLASFMSGSGGITPFDYIIYDVDPFKFKIYYDDGNGNHEIGFHNRQNISTGEVVLIHRNRHNNFKQMQSDQFDIRSYGVVYSKARSGFKTNQVKTTTTMQLDDDKSNIDNEEDFTKIKQLIIDISAQDNSEYFSLAKTKKGKNEDDYENFIKNSRIFRFENAFNNFFENIKFNGVDEQNSEEKRIIFKKHDKEIPIDSLSTGEKQIVFRGAYLLKNQKILNGGIVLIDEPELSMHPLWQEKILDYYRNLFKTDDKQNVQMIIATHSEYVIKSALKDNENVLVIKLKNDNDIIKGEKKDNPSILNEITVAGINYDIFNIVSVDYNMQLYGYLQDIISDTYTRVEGCDKYIEKYIYDNNKEESKYIRPTSYKASEYKTIPTLIRNAISHYGNGNKYDDNDLRASIELLIEIIKQKKVSMFS